jgi:hypothetical protein
MRYATFVGVALRGARVQCDRTFAYGCAKVGMAQFICTGGESGEGTIEIAGKVYEAGDTVELSGKKDLWLVEQGHLVPKNTKGGK